MSELNYGDPAPAWLREAEIYNLYDRRRVQWLDDNQVHFPLVTHVPVSPEVVAKYHKAGTHVMPYVIFMELRGLAKMRPEWIRIDEHGDFTPSAFGVTYNISDQHSVCLNNEDLHELALNKVKKIMDMGYDGVFVDNVAPLPECHGGRLGKHTHTWKTKSNTECHYDLVAKIYQLVKSYGSDKAVMLNSIINDDLWRFCDAQMDEGIAFGGMPPRRSSMWNRVMIRYWKAHQEAARHGKAPVMLNSFDSLGGPEKILEGVFYTYVCCRLFDLLWADGTSLLVFGEELQWGLDAVWPFDEPPDPSMQYPGPYDTKRIYDLRMGAPLGDCVEKDFLLYRKFANGVVVLNGDEWGEREIVVPLDRDGVYEDVHAAAGFSADCVVHTTDKKLAVKLPSGAGRVYLAKGAVS